MVTGCVGFKGSNLTDRLIRDSYSVVSTDNFGSFYPAEDKLNNLKNSMNSNLLTLVKWDIMDTSGIHQAFSKFETDTVVHLVVIEKCRK